MMNDPQFIKLVATAIQTAVNAHAAALAVHALCIAKAKAEGMKPDIEVAIRSPGQPRHHSENNCWGVCFEAGPYDWAVDASLDAFGGKVMAEPYYGFDLSFYDV
jgi:hypothetical protein